MTAPTRTTRDILVATAVTAANAGSEAAPGIVGPWVAVDDLNGGILQPYVSNTGGAPGAPGQFILQASDVNTGDKISELWRGGGNTTASSSPPIPAIDVPSVYKYVRMLGFGHSNVTVTYRCVLFGKG